MVSGKCKQELTKTQKKDKIQTSKQEEPASQTTFIHNQHTKMTEKEKALVEALCDAYGIDYPEQGDNGDDEDMRSDEEIYFDKENSYSFTS